MKKLCIFDFDGTLFDSLPDVANSFNKTFELLGYEKREMDFFIKSLGGNIDEIIGLILQDENNPETLEKVKKTYEKVYHEDQKENTKLFKGILELLEQLQKEEYLLAINSNRQTNSIKMFTEKYAPHINFIDIQGHTYDNPSKPDPYGVNTIIEKANVTKNECVYIGDSITDIKTAENATIDCILVKWGYGVGDVYENEYPIAVVEEADELYQILKEK